MILILSLPNILLKILVLLPFYQNLPLFVKSRYADVIVHRLLLSALKEQDWWSNKDEKCEIEQMTNTQLSELCEHINERNKAAQLAQRQSQLLFQTLYFRDKEPDDPRCIVEAVIFRIRSNGFLVYVPSYALKGPVYLQVREPANNQLFKIDINFNLLIYV